MDLNNGLSGYGELDLTRSGKRSFRKEMQNDIDMSKNCGYNTTTPAELPGKRYGLRNQSRPGPLLAVDDDEDEEINLNNVNNDDIDFD